MGFFKDVMRGLAIGIANIIPGVSGGTMMVSMGIYNEVIGAVTGVFSHLKKSIRILLPYVIGMGIGIVGLSFVIGYFFEYYPLQTALLFMGLIFGGLPLIVPKVTGKRPSMTEILVFAVFFALVVWMQFWGEGTAKILTTDIESMVQLFFIGALAAATMVIPGVSGSMMLMSMGYYTPIIDHINAFVIALVTFDMGTVLYCMGILVPFGLGVVLGVFLISKLVEYLLTKHERVTYFAILGLVVSSPIAVLAGLQLTQVGIWAILAGIIMFGVGLIVAGLLGK